MYRQQEGRDISIVDRKEKFIDTLRPSYACISRTIRKSYMKTERSSRYMKRIENGAITENRDLQNHDQLGEPGHRDYNSDFGKEKRRTRRNQRTP